MTQAQDAKSGKPKQEKNAYKPTLNLPKTAFPMRANLVQNEPASQKRWAKNDLYAKVREARADESNPSNRGPWSFHDGPPYANGGIHTGHLLNKVLKDLVVRSRTMSGYDVHYVPGWDCHGLPIEHKVMTELVEKGKADKLNTLAEDIRRMAIRRECQASAKKFIKLQSGQMQRLLTMAAYDEPYLTMVPEYEAATLEVFADLVAQGLVYRDLKPVHWSIANQTALADAELEYADRQDVSVYVNFNSVDPGALAAAFGVDASELGIAASFMIWTTTPWTLPANLAIAVHERFEYSLVKLNDETVVVASELVEKVAGLEKASAKVLGTCRGEALKGLQYQHPFCDRTSPVVTAEYVTLEDGTGLVHTAPGHGADDYQTGLANDLQVYCPVLGDGTYDETVPEWLVGQSIWDANAVVMDHLRSSGHLYHDHTFMHSYPHDWRSKTPVIFRATEQWFVAVDKDTKRDGRSLRASALQVTADDVSFVPEWGRNRMRGMLESRPDWCLSRQRSWGLPIPAFETADGEVVMTEAMVRAVAAAVREKGSDLWFQGSVEDLLTHYDVNDDDDAPNGLDVVSLRKRYDIFDVWFESGSSWNAVMRQRGLGYPVDLYLEGSDQHRGWFQLSLLCGLGSTGVSPFKTLLTHGFMVDKDGKKLSKSLGNALEVDELLTHFGADVCRWWVASLNYENDIKLDLDFFKVAGESYRKVRNTLRFMLSNLYDFDPKRVMVGVKDIPATSLDAWVLDTYNDVAKRVIEAYEAYDFRGAHHALYNFCNDTLSAVYLAAMKDRLYCDTADSPRRRRCQSAMWMLTDGLARLLAPILTHTADEAYRQLHGCNKHDPKCVHLEVFTGKFDVFSDDAWPQVMEMRHDALRALEVAREKDIVENPLDARVNMQDPDGVLKAFAQRAGGDAFVHDFADLLGVSRVEFGSAETTVDSLADEPRCERSWKRDGTVKQRGDGGMLSDRDAAAVAVAVASRE